QVRPEMDAGEADVDLAPVVRADRDAVCGRAVHPVGVDALEDARPPVPERPRRGDRVTRGRLLHVGRDHPNLPELLGGACECGDTRAVDAVVVGNQDAHGPPFGPGTRRELPWTSPSYITRRAGTR